MFLLLETDWHSSSQWVGEPSEPSGLTWTNPTHPTGSHQVNHSYGSVQHEAYLVYPHCNV